MRRFENPPINGIRYVRRPGAYAILPIGDQVLLTHQSKQHPEFQLPGGGIDPGEGAIEALHREVKEETGWKISHPIKLGVYRKFVFMEEYEIQAEKICYIYVAKPIYQLHDPIEPDHSTMMMSYQDAIRDVANDGDAAFLANYFGVAWS